MTTLSLVTRNCGRGGRTNDWAFQSGLQTCVHKDLFTGGLLLGSVRRLNGLWLKNLAGTRIRSRNSFHIIPKAKKGNDDYPWPDNIDPNITSGCLKYLSYFKPLEEKPKPVTLAFEKPLVDLEKKIIEVRRMADETGLDFSDQISSLESKYQQALKDLYTHLTPIQRLSIARHPNRPTVLDHVLNITDNWVELHGDRAGYDDPAIVTGIGSIDGNSFMFIGHQKGRNTKENIERNFAMPTPHGYRKALRMMKYADHHGFPIITLVDTPGAFADLKSEELGQGEAIAQNLRTMFGLRVPMISVVTGEGGSGGALAICCANKLFMLENSAFYVASPEACAAILWKSSQDAPKAAEKLRITALEHYNFGIADGIIPEPLGGAHTDPVWTSQQIKLTIIQAMEELRKMDKEELLRHRMLKYRSIGSIQEGIPVDPEKRTEMKLSDLNSPKAADIESELENLKKQILEAEGPLDPITDEAIDKLEEEVDEEITNAFISMGLQEKLESLHLELYNADDLPEDPNRDLALEEKAERLMEEFKHNLKQPGAYLGLKQKLEMLDMVYEHIEQEEEAEELITEINQNVPEEVKARMEALKKAEEKLSEGYPVDDGLAEEVEKAKTELEEVLKSANLDIVGMATRSNYFPTPDLVENVKEVNIEIDKEIERAINVTGLEGKIEELNAEIEEDPDSEKVKKLMAEIKEQIAAAMDVTTLKEKYKNLTFVLESLPTSETEMGEAVLADNSESLD